MTTVRKILIADPELDAVRALSKALRQRGYQVHYAADGSKALEVCVLRHPDLALFDEQCPLIDARSFQQILRTNPRTGDIPVVLTAVGEGADKGRGFRDGVLRKPFNVDEVLARIDHIFRRSDAASELKGEAKEIEGNLSQLSIADLLQILAMNKRSGRLTLARGEVRGEIHVTLGRPVNARVGTVEGEKALFRLLSWSEGTFEFVQGGLPPKVRIDRGMDDALLEGMRQSDEAARLLPAMPPRNTRLGLAPDAGLSLGHQHPVTAQVVELMQEPRTLPELLDLCSAPDLEVLGVMATLLQRGVAIPVEGAVADSPLLGPAELHALRARLFRTRVTGSAAVAKVFLCAETPKISRRLLRELPDLLPVASEPGALRSGFGTLGRYELSEALKLDFCMLPASSAARPMWRPFSTGAAGVLMLDTSPKAIEIGRYLAFNVRMPIVVMGDEMPDALAGAPVGSALERGELRDGLRTLLMLSIQSSAGTS